MAELEEKVEDNIKRLDKHDELIAELQRADDMLANDVRLLRQDISNGFIGMQHELRVIHEAALPAVPEKYADRISLHLLVWQVVGTVALLGGTVAAIVALVK